MNELMTKRTPEILGAEIRNLTAAAKYTTLWYGVQIGRRLTEAKELVPHGEWMHFLQNETEFSQPTASRFMRLFQEYGAEQGSIFGAETKYSTLNNLSISNALRLLAVPEEEREGFAAEVDAEHISSRELEEAIKAREAAEQALADEKAAGEGAAMKLSEAQEQRDAFREKLYRQAEEAQTLRERVKELESRPIDVAVQNASEEQIEKAKAAGKAEAYEQYTKEQEKLRKEATKAQAALETERNDLRKKLEEAQEQLAAPKDTAEEERLIAELEAAKKKLAMSSEGMVRFKLHFGDWQRAYAEMQEAMESLTEEQQTKCRAAMQAVIGSWA